MGLAVPADAEYVFDLIGLDSERLALAVARGAALVEVFRNALAGYNELWFKAGGSWQPRDTAVLATMDQARAAMSAAKDRTPHGIAGEFIHARWFGGPDDHERLAPYAVLFLKWEEAPLTQPWSSARDSPRRLSAGVLCTVFLYLRLLPKCSQRG